MPRQCKRVTEAVPLPVPPLCSKHYAWRAHCTKNGNLLLRVPLLGEFRRSEVPEKLSFYLRFVSGAHKPHNDALYPRCAKLSWAGAIQNFTNTCADRVEIWFRVISCHRRFSFSFCCLQTG